MRVHRHDTVQDFLDRAEGYLLAHEVEAGLIMGIARRLDPDAVAKDDVYFATVLDDDETVVGCLMRTPPHGLVLTDVPDAAHDAILESVASAYDELPGFLGPADDVRAIARRWADHAGVGMRENQAQRIHVLREVSDVPMSPGQARLADANDVSIATSFAKGFYRDAHAPQHGVIRTQLQAMVKQKRVHLWEDAAGNRVSMAAAIGPTENGSRIGYVYTPPAERKKGYATSLVASLSRLLLEQGRQFCFLYTDLANPTSNAIYHRIGYRPVQDVLQVVTTTTRSS